MGDFFASLGQWITAVSDFVCGYPLFILLVGGGLYFLLYSGFVPLRYYGKAIKALKSDDNSKAEGQISSFEALASAVAATLTTVFMGPLSDKLGKRKLFICSGYILWGISIFSFILLREDFISKTLGMKVSYDTNYQLVANALFTVKSLRNTTAHNKTLRYKI